MICRVCCKFHSCMDVHDVILPNAKAGYLKKWSRLTPCGSWTLEKSRTNHRPKSSGLIHRTCDLPSGKQTWQAGKSNPNWSFNRNITYKQCIFHCHVWLPEGRRSNSNDFGCFCGHCLVLLEELKLRGSDVLESWTSVRQVQKPAFEVLSLWWTITPM